MNEQVAEAAEFEAKYSRPRLLIVCSAGILMTAVSLLCTGLLSVHWFAKDLGVFWNAFGAFGVLFFGGHTLRAMGFLHGGGIAISISQNGLIDHRVSSQRIDWKYIDRIFVRRSTQSFFGFFSITTSKHICYKMTADCELKVSLWNRWNEGLNSFFRFSHSLHHQATDRSLQEIGEALNAFAPRRLQIDEFS